jgi:hypothetical protein
MSDNEQIGGRVGAAPGPRPDQDPEPGDATRAPRLGSWLLALLGAVILPLTMVVTLTFTGTPHAAHAIDAAGASIVSSAALESRYGIRVVLVAVTAEGGLVDVRFTVTDQAKATAVLGEHGAMPALFVEASGAVLSTSHPMAHKISLLQGGSYFLLYPNAAGAVQPGTPVSIVVDDVRLASIVAQS